MVIGAPNREIHATEHGAGFFFELGDGSYEVSGSLAANGDLAFEREGRRVSASVLPAGDELHVFLIDVYEYPYF